MYYMFGADLSCSLHLFIYITQNGNSFRVDLEVPQKSEPSKEMKHASVLQNVKTSENSIRHLKNNNTIDSGGAKS